MMELIGALSLLSSPKSDEARDDFSKKDIPIAS